MGALSIITALRKLRYFLTAMFPALERIWNPLESAVAKVAERLALARHLERLKSSRIGRITERSVRNFWWSNYSKDIIDPATLPGEVVQVLRPVFLMAAILCLLLPIAMQWPYPSLSSEAIAGAKGLVATWYVLLWLPGLALGWSCLLAGSIASNRIALLSCLILYLFFMGAAATSVPRSFANLAVPIVALIAAGAGEYYHHGQGRHARIAGMASSLGAGMMAGIPLIALTPLARLFPKRVLGAGLILGAFTGLLVWAGICAFCRRGLLESNRVSNAPVHRLTFLFALGSLFHLVLLAARGGLAGSANATLGFLTLWTQYLWPLYYFIGVGVVFKLIGQAQFYTLTLEDLIPRKIYVTAATIVILFAAATAWSPTVLDTPSFPWPGWVNKLAGWLYEISASRIWADPIHGTTWEWLRWVLLADIGLLLWLCARRELKSERISSLLFSTVLLGFGLYEYLFQMTGLARTGTHSALVLFTFSIVILWTVHKAALQFCLHSSERWPLPGRFGIYGGILLFVLLSVQARGAIHDTRIMEEVFLYFFNGMIAVGLPFALYVYASRRFANKTIALPSLFGAFAFGAAMTLPLIAMDKLVAAGGSVHTLLSVLSQQREVLLTSGLLPRETPILTPLWIAVRGAIAIGSCLALAFIVARRTTEPRHREALFIFFLMASAMGFAAFSKTSLDLPLLPLRVSLLLTPFGRTLLLDTSVVATYLAYALPALVIGLTFCNPGMPSQLHRPLALLAAYGLHLIIALSWPAHEAWLRSTGVWITQGLACILLLCVLFLAARSRLESLLSDESAAVGSLRSYGRRRVFLFTASTMLVLAGLGLFQAFRGRLLARSIPEMKYSVPVPAQWVLRTSSQSAGNAAFTRPSFAMRAPTLLIDWKQRSEVPAAEFLEDFVRDASSALPDFAAKKPESWNERFVGAVAVDFGFNRKLTGDVLEPVFATKLALPYPGHGLLTLTVLAGLDEWQAQRWDLVRIAQSLQRTISESR
jgi:hypothetical protein